MQSVQLFIQEQEVKVWYCKVYCLKSVYITYLGSPYINRSIPVLAHLMVRINSAKFRLAQSEWRVAETSLKNVCSYGEVKSSQKSFAPTGK